MEDVHFHLGEGEFAFLQGRSGSGKSTLLRLLYRETECDSGTILIDGQSIDGIPKYVLRRKMGIVFQSFDLLERKTVLENVMLAGRVLGRSRKEIEKEARRLLERAGLSDKLDEFPDRLSGGQQQRTAVVRALLNRPRLILADEPTGSLDEETAFDVLMLMRELHEEEGVSMLVITHSGRLLEQFEAKKWMIEAGGLYECK